MNVLIVNPILYTSETKKIKRAKSIKNTMIYDLCLAFKDMGHEVILYAAEPYKPINEEEYPFLVIWGKCAIEKLCFTNTFPYLSNLPKYIRKNKAKIDLILCSEAFSINTLNAVLINNKKVIIWHELARHNAMMKRIPSIIWYNFIVRFFMKETKIVARSTEARNFICRYCKSTSDVIIDHGVNLDKFVSSNYKEDYFVVCSQLINRKRIDGILREFANYLKITGANSKLYIIGDGILRETLEKMSLDLGINNRVIFTGKLEHEELLPYLSHAQAMLVNTEKDNSMISIVESIAVGTPVITTEIPLNASYIKNYQLGLAKDWVAKDLADVVENNKMYVVNCLKYRDVLSTKSKASQFISITMSN